MPRHKKNRGRRSETDAQQISERRPTKFPVALGLILLATLIVYLPALNGAQLWDDDANITRPELEVQRLQKELEPVAKLEQSPQMQGRRIVVIFAPK